MVLCPQCQKSFFAEPIPEDETEGFRACPFCHERIRAGAKKCRWCQSLLDNPTQQEAKPQATHLASIPEVPANAPSDDTPSQDSPKAEEELFSMHPTWKRLLAPMAVAALLILLSIPFLRELESSMYVMLLALLACMFWFLKRLLDIITTHYVLTTERLSVRTGLISREEVEIRVSDIRAVWLKQNIWERCLNFGDVLIGTSATAGAEISIADIDAPREILDLLHDLAKV